MQGQPNTSAALSHVPTPLRRVDSRRGCLDGPHRPYKAHTRCTTERLATQGCTSIHTRKNIRQSQTYLPAGGAGAALSFWSKGTPRTGCRRSAVRPDPTLPHLMWMLHTTVVSSRQTRTSTGTVSTQPTRQHTPAMHAFLLCCSHRPPTCAPSETSQAPQQPQPPPMHQLRVRLKHITSPKPQGVLTDPIGDPIADTSACLLPGRLVSGANLHDMS